MKPIALKFKQIKLIEKQRDFETRMMEECASLHNSVKIMEKRIVELEKEIQKIYQSKQDETKVIDMMMYIKKDVWEK